MVKTTIVGQPGLTYLEGDCWHRFHNHANNQIWFLTLFNDQNSSIGCLQVEWKELCDMFEDVKICNPWEKNGHLTSELKISAEDDSMFIAWQSESFMVIVWLINLMDFAIGRLWSDNLLQRDANIVREPNLYRDTKWECFTSSARYLRKEENDLVCMFPTRENQET